MWCICTQPCVDSHICVETGGAPRQAAEEPVTEDFNSTSKGLLAVVSFTSRVRSPVNSPQVSVDIAVEELEFNAVGATKDDIAAAAVASLGAGGASLVQLTPEAIDVRDAALRIYHDRHPARGLSKFQRDWLTAKTLEIYVCPPLPERLADALWLRGEREDDLTRKDIWLNGSLRVVGHDKEGASILSWETVTMRKSFAHYITHAELLFHTALDMNSPGSSTWIQMTYCGGGWNPLFFLNPAALVKFYVWFEGQFRKRLKLALFIDVPQGFGAILKVLMRSLKPKTKEKFVVCSAEEAISILKERCDSETVGRIENFMANRRQGSSAKQLWHPVVDLPWFRERLKDLAFDGDSKTTLRPDELLIFREAIREWRAWKWGSVPEIAR